MAMNTKILGSGKQTLVLAHGYGSSQAAWDNIVPALADKYRVLVFDWSFSGAIDEDDDRDSAFDDSRYSSYHAFADDLVSVIDETGMNVVVYVGHSMAGMIGCIASIKRPDLFSRLVLVGASPRYINDEGYEGGFEKIFIDNMLSNIESNFDSWAEAFIPLLIGADDPPAIKKLGNDFKRMKPNAALSVARTIFLGDYRDILDHVEVPCTLVHGTSDATVPLSVGRYMKSRMRGQATLEVIEMDGHFPQLTVPEKLIDVVDRAMSQR